MIMKRSQEISLRLVLIRPLCEGASDIEDTKDIEKIHVKLGTWFTARISAFSSPIFYIFSVNKMLLLFPLLHIQGIKMKSLNILAKGVLLLI